jgi:hypothetical protein
VRGLMVRERACLQGTMGLLCFSQALSSPCKTCIPTRRQQYLARSFEILLLASLRSIFSKASSVLLPFAQNSLTLLIGRGRLLGTRV